MSSAVCATRAKPSRARAAQIATLRKMGATIGEPVPCFMPVDVIGQCLRLGHSCAVCECNPANAAEAGRHPAA